MNKRSLILLCILSLAAVQAFAGDIAVFKNLGFSEDSRYFLFGQYGITAENPTAYAELFAVDIAANRFASDGVLQKEYQQELYPGQDGSGALLMALREFSPVSRRYGINHLASGRIVYLLMNGAEPQKRLEFRDFQRGERFVVDLIQHQYGSGEGISSSFHLSVSVTSEDGGSKTYRVGHPDFRRKGVLAYRIKEVVFSPDEQGLVFVIEREELDGDGNNIRYMVETLRW